MKTTLTCLLLILGLSEPAWGAIVFDNSPGAAAPPAIFGGYQMTPFPLNWFDPPPGGSVSDIPAPRGTNVTLSHTLLHGRVGGGDGYDDPTGGFWAALHPYDGDVYATGAGIGATPLTLKLPASTKAFYFYLHKRTANTTTFAAAANGMTSSGDIEIAFSNPAIFFGFYLRRRTGSVELGRRRRHARPSRWVDHWRAGHQHCPGARVHRPGFPWQLGCAQLFASSR